MASSCSHNIVAALLACLTVDQEDGGSPSPVHAFLSSVEQRYAAIKGEAVAMAWGLEQTRYFTQGWDNLVVVTRP